jgi:hypothetical protein
MSSLIGDADRVIACRQPVTEDLDLDQQAYFWMGTDELLSHPVCDPPPVKDWGLYLIRIEIAIAIAIRIAIGIGVEGCASLKR